MAEFLIQKAVALLNGAARRMFMASVVKQMDRGGQRLASVELGWNRDVIRKGLHELQSGIVCVDASICGAESAWKNAYPLWKQISAR